MNHLTVYQVARALSKEEQFLLFEKLKNDFTPQKNLHRKRKEVLTKEKAIHYLLNNFFRKK